jgi:hypothetical protein
MTHATQAIRYWRGTKGALPVSSVYFQRHTPKLVILLGNIDSEQLNSPKKIVERNERGIIFPENSDLL